MIIRKADGVDILLICEGTFPYIKGGVSSWIYQLITGLKDFSFGVIFLGGIESDYKDIKYDLPDNLIHLETHFLFEEINRLGEKRKIEGNMELYDKMTQLHNWFRKNDENLSDEIKHLNFYDKIDQKQFLYSRESFKFITKEYNNNCPDVPFIEYFWTVRNTHAAIWVITDIAKNVPKFKIVHSPSTGYAGFLASFLKNTYNKKFVLTEHGIYFLERKIDIMISNWIKEYRINLLKDSDEKNYIKEIWIKFFKGINKFAYDTADLIVSLYSEGQKQQILLGADREKTLIIPNGVNIKNFTYDKNKYNNIPKAVALIGRIVPIKDVKTFITAFKIASDKLKNLEGFVVGPFDEDREYYDECIELTKTLNVENQIKFTGYMNINEILTKIGLLTLTSISEGMPLVVLEGFASGIPAVLSDVGSCKELIYGKDEEDIKLGKAGEIVPVANSAGFANAYVNILSDKKLWKRYSDVSYERVRRYYDEEKLLNKYKEIYIDFIEKK
jgi:glycosyltransferase involved in cell wall biosynthesis